jgi:SPP1 family predicted phage head-tail adaptor
MPNAKLKLSQLRCYIDIQRKTLTPDGIGGNKISYTTISSTWAMLEDWKGKENYRAERTEGLVYQRVVVRGSTDIEVTDIVVYQGRTMPVKYKTNIVDGQQKYIECLCIEGDPTGPGAE